MFSKENKKNKSKKSQNPHLPKKLTNPPRTLKRQQSQNKKDSLKK